MTNEKLSQDVHHRIDELRTLRDELKVRLHLGGMDVKEAWEKLSSRLDALELDAKNNASHVAADAGKAIEHLATSFKDLGARLTEHKH